MTGYTLHIGDCAEVMREQIADGAIDLTVTSPPYDNLRRYNGYTFDFEAIAAELWRVTKPGGVVVWVVADATINGSETGTSFRQALHFKELGFNLHDTMIYESQNTGAKGSNLAYWQSFEFMFVFSRGRPNTVNRLQDRRNVSSGTTQHKRKKYEGARTRTYGDRRVKIEQYGYRTNIWRYHSGLNGDDQTDHIAPFPEALARDHIISWSNPGDVVLDPMCGSGTTGKQAVLLGRDFIGIDISVDYIDGIARPRIEWAASQARQLDLFSVGGPAARLKRRRIEAMNEAKDAARDSRQ